MNTRTESNRHETRRMLRSPAYHAVHERNAAKVTEMEAALRDRNAQILTLKAKLEKSEADLKSAQGDIDNLKGQIDALKKAATK